jgi:carbon storage regulator
MVSPNSEFTEVHSEVEGMLVLSRKLGEVIRIGKDIRITVVSIHPAKVRVGIEAPMDVMLDREEIYLKKLFSKTGLTVEFSEDDAVDVTLPPASPMMVKKLESE